MQFQYVQLFNAQEIIFNYLITQIFITRYHIFINDGKSIEWIKKKKNVQAKE